MSDRVPDMSDPLEDQGIPNMDEQPPGLAETGAPEEEMMVPGDEPVAVDEYGTTDQEQRTPESLAERMAREEPDVFEREEMEVAAAGPTPSTARPWGSPRGDDGLRDVPDDLVDVDDLVGAPVGRLVDDESDEPLYADDEAQSVALDVGLDGGGLTAEESAMHIESEGP